MEQYISKDVLVAEIERLKEQDYPCDTFEESIGYYTALDEITTFLDTLKVKEVDLKLTLEDVSMIRQIIFDYNRQVRNEMSNPNDEEYCKEVLKRFKAQKGEKI